MNSSIWLYQSYEKTGKILPSYKGSNKTSISDFQFHNGQQTKVQETYNCSIKDVHMETPLVQYPVFHDKLDSSHDHFYQQLVPPYHRGLLQICYSYFVRFHFNVWCPCHSAAALLDSNPIDHNKRYQQLAWTKNDQSPTFVISLRCLSERTNHNTHQKSGFDYQQVGFLQ